MSLNSKLYTPASVSAHNMMPTLQTEPMNLGSPTTSPLGNQPNGVSNQYLPGFLLGEPQQATNLSCTSALKNKNSRLPRSPAEYSGSRAASHPVNFGQSNERVVRRLTSPPTQSIWSLANGPTSGSNSKQPNDHLLGGIKHSTPNGATLAPSSVQTKRFPTDAFLSPGPNTCRTIPQSPLGVPPTTNFASPVPLTSSGQPNLMTPDRIADIISNQQNNTNNAADDCWVTVFGFPPARSSFILNQFAQFGTIEKHVITNNGNWMHIKYQNRMQARCALGKNGRLFGDNIMVGVSKCTDKAAMDAQTNDGLSRPTQGDTSFFSPIPSASRGLLTEPPLVGTPVKDAAEFNSFRTPDRSFHNQILSPPERVQSTLGRHNSMRSLAANGRLGGLSRTSSVRHEKESGLLSKALGYMFGWS